MKTKSRIYNTIIQILCQHKKYWLDIRHLFTLAWMVAGLIKSVKAYLHGYLMSKVEPNMHKVFKTMGL